MKHFNFFKSERGRSVSSPLLKLCMLIAMMAVGINCAWARTVFSADLSDINIFSDGENEVTGGLLKWDSNTFYSGSLQIENKNYYRLQRDGNITLCFPAGSVKVGDVLTARVVCGEADKELEVNVANGRTETRKSTAANQVFDITHIILANEIQTDGVYNKIVITRTGEWDIYTYFCSLEIETQDYDCYWLPVKNTNGEGSTEYNGWVCQIYNEKGILNGNPPTSYFHMTHVGFTVQDDSGEQGAWFGIKGEIGSAVSLAGQGVPYGGTYINFASSYPGTVTITGCGGTVNVREVKSDGSVVSSTEIVGGVNKSVDIQINAYSSYYVYASDGSTFLLSQVGFKKSTTSTKTWSLTRGSESFYDKNKSPWGTDVRSNPQPTLTNLTNGWTCAYQSDGTTYVPGFEGIQFDSNSKVTSGDITLNISGSIRVPVKKGQVLVITARHSVNDDSKSALIVTNTDGTVSTIDIKGVKNPAEEYSIIANDDTDEEHGTKYVVIKNGASTRQIYISGLRTEYSNKMPYFENSVVTTPLDEYGNATFPLQTLSNRDENVVYDYVIEDFGNGVTQAGITEDDNGNGWKVSISGAGRTVVKAKNGPFAAIYTIYTTGFSFPNAAVVYDFNNNNSYQQQAMENGSPAVGVEYSVEQGFGEWANVQDIAVTLGLNSDGQFTKMPAFNENKGGAILVKATRNNDAAAYYMLTIPYKHKVWNFYDTGEDVASFSPGPQARSFPSYGSAGRVPEADNLDGVNYIVPAVEKDKKALESALKKRKQWNSEKETDEGPNKDSMWNYTFKTMQWDATRKNITYVNEPLFSYCNVVNGNNALVVKETAGLVFHCHADRFGINMNTSSEAAGDFTAHRLQEEDRAILLGSNPTTNSYSSFTIPHVKKGHYVKLHWYRHSDNAGDKFKVSGAMDLDGHAIDPNHVLRFTGSHYQSNCYRGCTFFRANPTDGKDYCDITITMVNGWSELYEIEVTDVFETELSVLVGDVERGKFSGLSGHETNIAHNLSNVHDLNKEAFSIVRYKKSTSTYSDDDLQMTGYRDWEHSNAATIDNYTKLPSNQFGDNPIVYISSYPGKSYGWNGWDLDVEATPVAEDKWTSGEPPYDRKLSVGTIRNLRTLVGTRLAYRMTALTNFKGTGVLHVIVRTKSNWSNNDNQDGYDPSSTTDQGDGNRYTLDMQEAYIPVGEYRDQTYPYTWDFTEENLGSSSAGTLTKHNYETGLYWNDGVVDHPNWTMDLLKDAGKDNGEVIGGYGRWEGDDNSKIYKLITYKTINPTIPYDPSDSTNAEGLKAWQTNGTYDNGTIKTNQYNKYLYADGAELTTSDMEWSTGARYIREAEGLRMKFTKNNTNKFDENDMTIEMTGRYLKVPGTITIPQVDGMYIFVKSSSKPECKEKTAITSLTWVENDQECTNEIGSGENAALIYGTDAGTPTSYVDVTGYSFIRVYGTAESGVRIRAMLKLGEQPSAEFIDGVATIDISKVIRDDSGKVLLYGIKTQWLVDGFPTANVTNIELSNDVEEVTNADVINSVTDKYAGRNTEVTLTDTDIPTGVYVYKVEANGINKDVNLTFAAGTEIYKIGVTDEFKMMTNTLGRSTESRRLRINYDYSGEFTKRALTAYKGTKTVKKACGHPAAPGQTYCDECGTLTLTPIAIVKGTETGRADEKNNNKINSADIDNNSLRGLVLHEKNKQGEETQSGNNKIDLIPLFVPANNQVYEELGDNLLQNVIEPTLILASDANYMVYVYTNKYYRPSNKDQELTDPTHNFYIVRESDTSRSHAAYLKIARGWGIGNSVKRFYIYYGDADEETGIEDITMPNAESDGMGINLDDAEIYTLSGIKLNGLPTQKGVYIINGKKMMVK